MAGETSSTNMGMPIPGVGSTAGPTWASDLNASLTIVDAHDHSTGSGVAITPSGMNINADLPFGTHSATGLLKASFTSQSAALTGTSFLSFVGGNLYVNDSSGNQIPITSGGGVAGSPGSIGSLAAPASATYSVGSKLFSWKSDSTKAAAMDNGAVTIRETNVASAKGITIASPSSLAADYSLTLLTALPASTKYLSCDSSGNLGTVTGDAIVAAGNTTTAWSPSFSPSSGVITPTVVLARYWKTGNIVFYTLFASILVNSGAPTIVIFTMPIVTNLAGNFITGSGYVSKSGTNEVLLVTNNDDTIYSSITRLGGSAWSGANVINIQGFYAVS